MISEVVPVEGNQHQGQMTVYDAKPMTVGTSGRRLPRGADECSHDDEAVVVVCYRLHTQRSTAVCLPASSRRARSSDAPTTSA